MPFGEYRDFADCVRRNQDKRDPEAYCAEVKRRVEGYTGPERRARHGSRRHRLFGRERRQNP